MWQTCTQSFSCSLHCGLTNAYVWGLLIPGMEPKTTAGTCNILEASTLTFVYCISPEPSPILFYLLWHPKPLNPFLLQRPACQSCPWIFADSLVPSREFPKLPPRLVVHIPYTKPSTLSPKPRQEITLGDLRSGGGGALKVGGGDYLRILNLKTLNLKPGLRQGSYFCGLFREIWALRL